MRLGMLFILILIFGIVSPILAFQFRYINDSEMIDFTAELLLKHGIPESAVNQWIDYIEESITLFDFTDQTSGEWQESDGFKEYAELPFSGGGNYVNCRIGTFTLIRDLISAEKNRRSDVMFSVEDKEIGQMEDFFDPELSDNDRLVYRSLFGTVNIAQGTITEDSFQKAIDFYQTWWNKEGLIFPKEDSIGIVQVMVVMEAGTVWEDHVGLLIEDDGGYYFIEKISPIDPFMISFHIDYNSLGEYQHALFDDWEGSGVMILRNDEIMWSTINE